MNVNNDYVQADTLDDMLYVTNCLNYKQDRITLCFCMAKELQLISVYKGEVQAVCDEISGMQFHICLFVQR